VLRGVLYVFSRPGRGGGGEDGGVLRLKLFLSWMVLRIVLLLLMLRIWKLDVVEPFFSVFMRFSG